IDELQLLDDRAGPSVRNDDRQRILMFRTDVDEMDVQPVDLGDEVRYGIQPRLARAPVIFRPPITRELLNRRELYAFRLVLDRFAVGPLRRVDAPAHIGKLRIWETHPKWPNGS